MITETELKNSLLEIEALRKKIDQIYMPLHQELRNIILGQTDNPFILNRMIMTKLDDFVDGIGSFNAEQLYAEIQTLLRLQNIHLDDRFERLKDTLWEQGLKHVSDFIGFDLPYDIEKEEAYAHMDAAFEEMQAGNNPSDWNLDAWYELYLSDQSEQERE